MPGPVFIHKDNCETYDAPGFPADLVDLPLPFEGFGENSELIRRERVKKENVQGQIEEMLEADGVKFINLRNAEAGCFVARIDRANREDR